MYFINVSPMPKHSKSKRLGCAIFIVKVAVNLRAIIQAPKKMPRKSRKVLEIEQKLATRVERRKLKRRDRKLGREERQFSDDDKENVSEVWGSSMNTTVQTNVSEVVKQQIQTGPSSSSTPTPAEATKETRKSSEWGTLINEQETLPEDQPDQNTESEENAEKTHKHFDTANCHSKETKTHHARQMK